MAKKKAKAATTRKTTTKRKPMTMTQSAKTVGTAKTAFSGRGDAQRIKPQGGAAQSFVQNKVRLYTGGKRNKQTMTAAKGSKQNFVDRNGKKVSKTKAARKDGTLRSGFQMVTQGPGGRNKETVTGGSTE